MNTMSARKTGNNVTPCNDPNAGRNAAGGARAQDEGMTLGEALAFIRAGIAAIETDGMAAFRWLPSTIEVALKAGGMQRMTLPSPTPAREVLPGELLAGWRDLLCRMEGHEALLNGPAGRGDAQMWLSSGEMEMMLSLSQALSQRQGDDA